MNHEDRRHLETLAAMKRIERRLDVALYLLDRLLCQEAHEPNPNPTPTPPPDPRATIEVVASTPVEQDRKD